MIKRSLPNGRTDVIKAMGNTKWGDIELMAPLPPALAEMSSIMKTKHDAAKNALDSGQ